MTAFFYIAGTLLVAATIFMRFFERREFNRGTCRKCGGRYRYFDTDSQGGDGYCCDKCGKVIWVNWMNREVKE